MADQYTVTTTTGWGSRIGNSIKGVLIGFIMFIISFGVLYWNEGRVDVSEIAKTAAEISATAQAPSGTDGQLVSTTGVLKSDEKIGDTYLQPGDYIAIKRNVEMYAWEESEKSSSKTNVGGSQTTETTYSYSKNWTSSPESSAGFKQQEGHLNPTMLINANSVVVQNAKVGIYGVDMAQVTLPPYKGVQLNTSNTILSDGLTLANEQHLFKGTGSMSSPQVGDIRVSYTIVPNPLNTATIFGKLDLANSTINPYYGEKNARLYRIFEGTRDSAISTMKTEFTILTWILRGVGFFLMWMGLMSLFGPISVFLDVLPIFGSISRGGIGIVTFFVSLILSAITILVSMIIHNVIALIVVILAVIVGSVWYMKNKRKKQTIAPTGSPDTGTPNAVV